MNKNRPLNNINLQNQRFSLSKPPVDDLFKRTKATLSDLHTLVQRKLPQSLIIEVQSISNVDHSDRDPISMILWLKHSFQVLLQSAGENNQDQLQNYESMLQKLQNDIRQHIRIQQQMKIYTDSVQARLQQANKRVENLQQQNKLLKNKINDVDKRRQRHCREQRQSLGKSKKSGHSLKIRDKSTDLKKSIAKSQVTQRVRKMKQQACATGIGTFRPSLTKLSKKI